VAAIDKLQKDFEAFESFLISKGGKLFYEIHPEIQRSVDSSARRDTQEASNSYGFEVYFKFFAPDMSSYRHEGCEALFESAWNEDLQAIKTMTLARWGSRRRSHAIINRSKSYQLHVTVCSRCFRGHLNVAKADLEIARAQYDLEKRGSSSYRVFLGNGHSGDDDDEDCSDDEVPMSTGDKNGHHLHVQRRLIHRRVRIYHPASGNFPSTNLRQQSKSWRS